jgi:hypothetical protein
MFFNKWSTNSSTFSVVLNRNSDRYKNWKLRTKCGVLPLQSHFMIALCANLSSVPMKNSQNRGMAFDLSEGDKPGREPRTCPATVYNILLFCLKPIFYLLFVLK